MNRDEWSKRAGRILHRISAVGVFGLSLELARSGAKPPDNLFELARAMPATTWSAPLIVAIDEAQRLPPGDRTLAASFVQTIHDSTSGLPLTLVLAGLGDTPDRAQEMGLTRGLKLYEVGRLSVEETDELMRGFCRLFGLRADGSEPFLAELAAGAEGWPRHLHFALQALGEEALAADGDLGRVSWSAAAKRAAESRLRYYRAQQSAGDEGCRAANCNGAREDGRAAVPIQSHAAPREARSRGSGREPSGRHDRGQLLRPSDAPGERCRNERTIPSTARFRAFAVF